jgi:hypothetical protein
MQRRQVLALGALSLATLGGCIGGGSDTTSDGGSDAGGFDDGDDDAGGFDDGGGDSGGDVGGGPPAPRRHSMVVADLTTADGALVATFESRPVVESRAAIEAPTVGVPAGERPDPSVTDPTPTPTPAANGTATGNGTATNATPATGTANATETGTGTGTRTGTETEPPAALDRPGRGPLATLGDLATAASPVGLARAGGRGGRGGRGGSDGGGLGGSGGSGSGGRTGRGGLYPPPGRHHDDDDGDGDEDPAGGSPDPAGRGWNGRPKWDADPELAEVWYATNGEAASVYRASVAAAGIASLGVEDVEPPGAGPVPWETVTNDPAGEIALSDVDPGWYRVGARPVGESGHDFGWTAVDALVEDGEGTDGLTVGRSWKVSPQL